MTDRVWKTMKNSTIVAMIVFAFMVVIMFICDICEVDKLLHLDSDWPAIICSATSVIATMGIGVATLGRAIKKK
jgi:hypothetical protein